MRAMVRRTMAFLWDRVEITRPHNLLVAGLTILVGWSLAGGGAPSLSLVLAIAAGTLVAAAGNVVNDYFDADIDRINKPRRPIPSGRMTRRQSWRYYWLLNAAVFGLALAAGPRTLAAALVWTACLYAYSAHLKTRFLLGNLMVSAVSSSGFGLGAWLAGRPATALVPACLAFLFIMGREIVKDVEDLPGDRACGARTLARRFGEQRALAVALGFFLLFAVLVPWPYWMRMFGRSYLLTYAFGVVPLLAVAMLLMLRDRSPTNLLRVSWLLKLDMLLGVIGFYLGHAR
jgi:geranylgeranylglycerol-phosphate geranylgeranyltransferase